MPCNPLHNTSLRCLGLVLLSVCVSVVCWHLFWGLIWVLDWLIATGSMPVARVPLLSTVAFLVGLALMLPLVLAAIGLQMLCVLSPLFALIYSLLVLLEGWDRSHPPRRRPFSAVQQARYDDMRATGWSALASLQAAERVQA